MINLRRRFANAVSFATMRGSTVVLMARMVFWGAIDKKSAAGGSLQKAGAFA
jgi:hypothetical protein